MPKSVKLGGGSLRGHGGLGAIPLLSTPPHSARGKEPARPSTRAVQGKAQR